MKIFRNKFLVKLIATLCLFLTLLNFAGASKVYAEDQVWGGVLIRPITSLLTALGDGIMDILHKAVLEQDTTLIKISGDETWWSWFKTAALVILAIVAAVAFVAAASATMGLANAALGVLAGQVFSFSMATVTSGMMLGGVVVGTLAGIRMAENWFPDNIYLPIYTLSVEEIFSNTIPLFDVNFFQPMDDMKIPKYTQTTKTITDKTLKATIVTEDNYNPDWMTAEEGTQDYIEPFLKKSLTEQEIADFASVALKFPPNIANDVCKYTDLNSQLTNMGLDEAQKKVITNLLAEVKNSVTNSNYKNWNDADIAFNYNSSNDGISWNCNIRLMFAGYYHQDIININIGEQSTGKIVEETLDQSVYIHSTAAQLKDVISMWYFILRNIALLVLMLVLIYTGIRIVIGSTAGEKAKYKERLIDWLVALCLVMIMHYIMVFAVNLVNEITNLVQNITDKNINGAYIPLTQTQFDNAKQLDFSELGMGTNEEGLSNVFVKDATATSGHAIAWQTNLTGLFRLQAQLENEGTAKWVGYSFCYIILVLYTLFFAFTYIRRVVYMAFLTMVAPLVAMTYPIDKMTDGKAQAFDAWFKEYIFNLMIQPLHLLLYTLLVTSAFMLVTNNAIYALVAIGFILPAEKLMRRFFGFEKAKTPGLLGGAAGAAIAMTGLQKILGHKSHSRKANGSADIKEKDQTKVKFANKNKINAMDAIAGENAKAASGDDKQDIKQKDINSNADDETKIREANKKQTEEVAEQQRQQANKVREENLKKIKEMKKEQEDKIFKDDLGGKIEPRKVDKPKRHIMRAVGTASLGVGKQVAAGALRGIHPLRMAGKIAVGATGATAGLLLGVASGDPNKAFQYTTGGAVAGAALAGSLSNRKNIISDDLKEETKMAFYGEDYANVYKEQMVEKQKRELENNRANINYLRQTMSVDEKAAREILSTTGEQCFDNGITDIEDIATIHKLTNGSNAMSFDKAVAARSYAKKRLGGADIDQMAEDKVQEYKNRWAKEFKDRYKNLSDSQAARLADQAFDSAIRFNSARSSLTKI